MQHLTILGGPKPYHEAVRARCDDFAIGCESITAAPERPAGTSVVLVYCADDEGWSSLSGLVDAVATVAVLPDLDVEMYTEALAKGAGAVHIDTSSEIILEVARAQYRGESLLPVGVTQHLARSASLESHTTSLTDLERSLADALLSGKTMARISQELSYSDRTIRRRLQSLYLKLGVQTRAAAVTRLRTNGSSAMSDTHHSTAT